MPQFSVSEVVPRARATMVRFGLSTPCIEVRNDATTPASCPGGDVQSVKNLYRQPLALAFSSQARPIR
jgi:hypothetical protein